MRGELDALLTLARIDATDVFQTVAERTGNSAVLFVPFDPPSKDEEAEFFAWAQKFNKLVPDIIFVHSAHDVSLEA